MISFVSIIVLFCKHMPSYGLRIRYWSSDVVSSNLEMRRSSEADRAGANDNNGKIGAGHGIHSSVLPASCNCGSKKEITQRVATSLALPTQPLSAQHSSAR